MMPDVPSAEDDEDVVAVETCGVVADWTAVVPSAVGERSGAEAALAHVRLLWAGDLHLPVVLCLSERPPESEVVQSVAGVVAAVGVPEFGCAEERVAEVPDAYRLVVECGFSAAVGTCEDVS